MALNSFRAKKEQITELGASKPMDDARYREAYLEGKLTDAEVEQGWFFCCEWDGLLIHKKLGGKLNFACVIHPKIGGIANYEQSDLDELSPDKNGMVFLEKTQKHSRPV